jgi:hypothetical protein
MASAAMDADPTLKGTDAAKQYNAIYSRLMAMETPASGKPILAPFSTPASSRRQRLSHASAMETLGICCGVRQYWTLSRP